MAENLYGMIFIPTYKQDHLTRDSYRGIKSLQNIVTLFLLLSMLSIKDINIYIYIYIYIYIWFKLPTLSSKVLNVTNRTNIFVMYINNNNQLSLHGVSWVLPNIQMTIQYYLIHVQYNTTTILLQYKYYAILLNTN